jgi:hypothetical protein
MPDATPKRPFPEDYLYGYSNEHVAYEIDHFFWLAQSLGSGSLSVGAPTQQDARRLNNILVEGFVLHLRNVIDFLYVKPQSTDIVAEDLLAKDEWINIRPPITATLEAARTRANKEIAHLTSARMAGSPPEKIWDFVGLANEIRPILKLMSQKAIPTRIGPNVVTAIR